MCVTGAERLGGSYTVVSTVCPAGEFRIHIKLMLWKNMGVITCRLTRVSDE